MKPIKTNQATVHEQLAKDQIALAKQSLELHEAALKATKSLDKRIRKLEEANE